MSTKIEIEQNGEAEFSVRVKGVLIVSGLKTHWMATKYAAAIQDAFKAVGMNISIEEVK